MRPWQGTPVKCVMEQGEQVSLHYLGPRFLFRNFDKETKSHAGKVDLNIIK